MPENEHGKSSPPIVRACLVPLSVDFSHAATPALRHITLPELQSAGIGDVVSCGLPSLRAKLNSS
jgi:hypothetical protein